MNKTSNTKNKRLLTMSDKTREDKPKNMLMIMAGILLIGFLIIALIVYYFYEKNSVPESYKELRPMMDEAIEFEIQASSLSKAYTSIENQVGEEAYFSTLEEQYTASSEVQANVLNKVQEQEDMVAERGGIVTVEDLEQLKKPATDAYAAKQVAKQLN